MKGGLARIACHGLLLVGAVITSLAIGCSRSADRAPPPDPLARLRTFEEGRRTTARFLDVPAQDHAFGTDPYDVASLADGRIAGILRGVDVVVLLDEELHELARVPAPRSPSAIAVYDGRSIGELHEGDVLVASELEPVLAHYRADAERTLVRLNDVRLGESVFGVRDIATGPEGVVYAIEEHDDRLITLRFHGSAPIERSTRRMPRGPIRLARTRHTLFVASLIDHTISALPIDPEGRPLDAAATAKIDGPYWGLAAIDTGEDEALLVAGGAEDHPLDRRGGFFGYVDSFVHVYRWQGASHELRRTASVNVSEHGLIVPKAIGFDWAKAAFVTSYGGASAARLAWPDGLDAPPVVSATPFPPGSSAIARTKKGFVAANPLLDAWVRTDDQAPTSVHVTRVVDRDHDTRTDRERIGEALFFTGLMAPSSSSDGAKSRFSCETCHFEGYVDGRVHHTGRGDVHATTKPLVGLFNNRPHFSRALDPDLSAVAENEFRVAGAPSPADPHFEVDTREVPWLAHLAVEGRHWDATELRLSLMAFLMSWTHRTNPRAAVTRSFTEQERDGAAAFRQHCERCHQARASADDPATRLPFERWESLIFGENGPLVWGSDAYEKTGIVPYVHEQGARVPSLRRLYKKRPYFTNGSAPDLATVLRRVRVRGTELSHHESATGDALDDATTRALAAFIDLL